MAFTHKYSNARACYQPKEAWDMNISQAVKIEGFRNHANFGMVTPFFLTHQRLPFGYTLASAQVAFYLNEADVLKVAAFRWEGSEEWIKVDGEHFDGTIPGEVIHDGRKFIWKEGTLTTLVQIREGWVTLEDEEMEEFEDFIQGYCPQAYAWAVSLD